MKRICIPFAVSLAAVFAAGPLRADDAKLNTSLRFLKDLRTAAVAQAESQRPEIAFAQSAAVSVTVKFDHVLADSEIRSLEQRGARFVRIRGAVARTGSIYPAVIPWEAIDELSNREDIVRMESAWRPAVFPLLDVSAHEIEADSAWRHPDPLGLPLSGTGMRIADFDTGVDVFHPSLFRADGDTLDWIDVDGFGSFTPGYDCVDLNKNGIGDLGELLRYYDGWIYDPAQVWGGGNPSNTGNGYQTYWDWLYNDANGNGRRDYGLSAGFTESSPSFGERVFIVLDDNGNGVLDVGEKLVMLKTSKVYATMNAGAVERVRGTDIIRTDLDTNGHGTSVSGILAGGTVGRHIFTGIAPDADILMGAFFSNNPISALIPWARARGANVMLYEFGGFIQEFLDGSSLDEELITTENDSIIQITPSGNLGRGNKHAIATVAAGDSIALNITVPAGYGIGSLYNTTLWRTSASELTFRMKNPRGGTVTLQGGNYVVNAYFIWCEKATSPRGTCAFNLYAFDTTPINPSLVGTWELKVVNTSAHAIEVVSNVADDVTSWADGAEFLNYATDQRNVTWPATADGAFVNGSYSTRGFEGYNGVGGGSIAVGQISKFSGRGVRIDGRHLLDVCSPGNYDVYTTRSSQDGGGYPPGGYRQFSGTSAAGPHVAAAAALVQQAFPFASMKDVATLITTHAAKDAFTGAVYNDTWGWGKLRILGAIGVATEVEDMAFGTKLPRLILDQNYPNPFNPTTWIPFYLPADGHVSLKIYTASGELVRLLADRWLPKGPHSLRWNGDDGGGRRVASGIYFCELKAGTEKQTRKLVLLR